jgi:uncharacterized protein (DUF924 family)
MERYREILDFWFGPDAGPGMWFGGGEALDHEVHDRFSQDLAEAVAGHLRAWEDSPESTVALVVLLDQFSLQLHRKRKRGYEQAALALPIAERAIAKGADRQLPCAQRGFLYMPFMHAEDRALQERSVELFSKLAQECGGGPDREAVEGFEKFSKLHRDIVAKYGRFPGRNACYGRANTPAEQEYLDKGGYF